MTGLVLKLKPLEKFLVNGAVLQNGERATRIRVMSNGAAVLRVCDVLSAEEAVTTVRSIYYSAQQAVMGTSAESDAKATITELLPALKNISRSDEAKALLASAEKALMEGKLFGVMRAMKKLFPFEDSYLMSASD